jgi:hypothetical protein
MIGADGSNAETGAPALNILHEGFIEYAVRNRTMIGFSLKYYKTTYDNHGRLEASFVETDPYGYSYANTAYGNPTGLYDITAMNFTPYFKFFKKGYLAPWGKYFMIAPVFSSIKTSYDPAKMKMRGYESKVNFGPEENEFSRMDIFLGFGRTRILADRITLDYGINFSVFGVLSTPGDLTGEYLLEEIGFAEITNNNYIARTSKRRVRSINRFNAFVRIGFLLF